MGIMIAAASGALIGALASPSFAIDLQPETAQAYDRYVASVEARMAHEEQPPERFLYIESLPQASQRPIWASLKRGEIWLEPLDATDSAGHALLAPHGIITHWLGAVFIPSASIGQVFAVIHDFSHFAAIYKPEIVRSRLIFENGKTCQIFLRLHKDTPWVNPTFDVNATMTYGWLGPDRAWSRVASTRIAQVEDAGKSAEHKDTVGRDGGYLWRLNTYWRLEEREGGVVAEWEAITLSRDIPFLLRWLVRPFVERLAQQTVRAELVATRGETAKRRNPPNPKP